MGLFSKKPKTPRGEKPATTPREPEPAAPPAVQPPSVPRPPPAAAPAPALAKPPPGHPPAARPANAVQPPSVPRPAPKSDAGAAKAAEERRAAKVNDAMREMREREAKKREEERAAKAAKAAEAKAKRDAEERAARAEREAKAKQIAAERARNPAIGRVLDATDHYGCLGVEQENFTEKALKKAYQQLSKDLHPDKSPGEQAKLAFQTMAAAYAILSDPEKRANYDAEQIVRTAALAAVAAGATNADQARAAGEAALMRRGHEANKRRDLQAARRHFQNAAALLGKPQAILSAANMALKLGQPGVARDEYLALQKSVEAGEKPKLEKPIAEMLKRKLAEANNRIFVATLNKDLGIEQGVALIGYDADAQDDADLEALRPSETAMGDGMQQAAAVTLQCTARKMLAKSVVKGLKADEFEKLKEEDRQRFEDDEKTFTLDLTRARASSSSPDNTSPSSSEGRAKRPSISERVASFRPFAMKGSKARASAGRRTMEEPPTASPPAALPRSNSASPDLNPDGGRERAPSLRARSASVQSELLYDQLMKRGHEANAANKVTEARRNFQAAAALRNTPAAALSAANMALKLGQPGVARDEYLALQRRVDAGELTPLSDAHKAMLERKIGEAAKALGSDESASEAPTEHAESG